MQSIKITPQTTASAIAAIKELRTANNLVPVPIFHSRTILSEDATKRVRLLSKLAEAAAADCLTRMKGLSIPQRAPISRERDGYLLVFWAFAQRRWVVSDYMTAFIEAACK